MKITTRKVAIVGCGLVGSTTAFSLVTQGVCDEVMLIDINEERAYGEMLDMRDSIEYLNRNVKVKTGTYAECGDMDIIVITAGAPPKQGQTRLDTLEMSAKIAKSIVATVYKGNIIKNLIMDCQSYTKYRPNETTGGIFVSWRRKEELPTGA